MKNFKVFSLLLVLLFSFDAFSRRILKVKGKKVYFSRKGLSVKKGQILSVYDGSYRVGKIKVYKLGKYGLAKLISGDVNRGDAIKTKRGSKRGSKSSRGFAGKWGNRLYLGAGIIMPSASETHEYGSLTALSLGYDMPIKLFKKNMVLMLNGAFSLSGTATLAKIPNNTEWDTAMFMINGDLAYPFNDFLYAKLGFGVTSFAQQGVVDAANGTQNNPAGEYKDSFLGINIAPGLGLKYDFTDKLAVKVDLTYRLSQFISASSDSVSGQEAEAGLLPHLNAFVYLGYKF